MLIRNAALLSVLVLLPSGCRMHGRDATLPPRDGVQIVAHRGASWDAPENTIAAFREAWKQGADWIEGDFRLSADGVIVCHHDSTTKKTANHDVPVTEQTLDELQALDVGRWKSSKYAGERIPTLDEVLAIVPENRGILIELKAGVEIVEPLAAALDRTTLRPDQMTIIAFDKEVIRQCAQRFPMVRTLWLTGFDRDNGGWSPSLDEVIATARDIGADGVDVDAIPHAVDQAFIDAVHEAGLECHVWTVNEADVARLMIERGVDSITTDRPLWLGFLMDRM